MGTGKQIGKLVKSVQCSGFVIERYEFKVHRIKFQYYHVVHPMLPDKDQFIDLKKIKTPRLIPGAIS